VTRWASSPHLNDKNDHLIVIYKQHWSFCVFSCPIWCSMEQSAQFAAPGVSNLCNMGSLACARALAVKILSHQEPRTYMDA
jgi:hypothetical protein